MLIQFRFLSLIFLLLGVAVAWADEPKISVQLEGSDPALTDSLIQGLSLTSHQNNPRLNQHYVDSLYQQGIVELKTMLSVYGYYSPEINGNIEQENDHWLVHYQIKLGQPVMIEKLTLTFNGEAKQDQAFQSLRDDFSVKPGQQLNHQTYEAAKKSILRLAASRGYFDGKFTQSEVQVNIETNTADVVLIYDAGIRYHIAAISFPQTVVNNSFLKKLLPFAENSPYSTDQVLSLRRQLTNSGYFESVNVSTLTEQRKDGLVPLSVQLEPKKKHLYSAGVGYGTDTGARLALGWENRYVNSRGHRLDTNLRASQVANSVSADYVMPFWSKTINTLGVTTEYKQEDTDTSESQSYALGSYYERERWGWKELGALKLLQEDFDISDDSESSLLLIPSVTWSRTWADSTIYTRHGGKLSLSLSGASESLLSDVSFVQFAIRGKYIHELGETGRFITRGSVGMTEVSDFNQLPSSLRFFTGGDNTIRGFDYQSLGPENNEGDVVGGRYEAVGSLEYENMLWGNWGAAVFTDFGNAFNKMSDPIEYSVGFGVRWRSPVGLIRVDLAKALSQQDEPIALHIVIGPDL